ncbi:hypothetical protein EYF80_024882 [Liparis tanakae]|uniref:Uncharacterized protein n=1 Tax=Liparis tanakae TaxID=230148 RepID=A0A4Z2HIX3_9TELE|nr:hypothetical protein EYF80_024882 [Liparis tanakae]
MGFSGRREVEAAGKQRRGDMPERRRYGGDYLFSCTPSYVKRIHSLLCSLAHEKPKSMRMDNLAFHCIGDKGLGMSKLKQLQQWGRKLHPILKPTTLSKPGRGNFSHEDAWRRLVLFEKSDSKRLGDKTLSSGSVSEFIFQSDEDIPDCEPECQAEGEAVCEAVCVEGCGWDEFTIGLLVANVLLRLLKYDGSERLLTPYIGLVQMKLVNNLWKKLQGFKITYQPKNIHMIRMSKAITKDLATSMLIGDLLVSLVINYELNYNLVSDVMKEHLLKPKQWSLKRFLRAATED